MPICLHHEQHLSTQQAAATPRRVVHMQADAADGGCGGGGGGDGAAVVMGWFGLCQAVCISRWLKFEFYTWYRFSVRRPAN